LGFEVELKLRSAEQVGRDFKFRLERSNLILRAPFFARGLLNFGSNFLTAQNKTSATKSKQRSLGFFWFVEEIVLVRKNFD